MSLFPAPRRLCAPRLLRSLMAGLALASMLAAPPAHAGSYTSTGSGGTSPATVTPAADATSSSPQDASARSSLSPYSPNGDPTYTIKISPGTLTDTFTWVPASGQTLTTDPPPTCVLVQQSSYAEWFVINEGGTGTGSGNPDCGLPGGTVTPSTYGGNGPSQSLRATLYSQKSGASFSVSSTPTVSFTGTTGTEGGVDGEARVGGGANVYPITLTIGGTNNPAAGDYRVLTGQQITATLNGIPTNYAVTKYTWSGQSATCFKTYNDQAPSNQLVPLGSADLTGPAAGSNTVAPLAFYDSAKENLTITCAITLTAPDGKSTVNLTATAPPINVLKPTATWTVNSTAPFGPQLDSSATGSMSFAVLWNASITVPSPFSGGSGCFAQIVNPTIDFQRHPLGNQPINCYLKVPQTNPDGTTTYVLPTTGLDTHFPYQASSTTLYPGGYMWDVSGAGQSGDQPGAGFAIPSSDNGGNNWYDAFDSDTFTTWLMYRPSSGGVWVPLQRVDWSWTGHVVKNAATGMWNSASNSSPPTTGSSSSPGIPVDTPPQWTTVNVGSNALRP